MTYVTDYCSLAELKAQLRVTDTDDDTALGIAITAASRAIDQHCNRRFGLTGSPAVRYYTYGKGVGALFNPFGLYPFGVAQPDGVPLIEGRQAVEIDDLMTTTGLTVTVDTTGLYTYSTTLTVNTDFDLWPWNAAAEQIPWTHMVLRPTAAVYWPRAARAISVSANWGWSSVPTVVKQAALVQAARFFTRRDAPFGIAGSPELGSETRLLAKLDPDVQLMLSTVRRWWGAVA